MTDLEDVQHRARLQEVARYTGLPRTVDEVAEHMGCHIQTARQLLWELQSQGRVREGKKRVGRRKTWQFCAEKSAKGDALVVTSAGTVSMRDLMAGFNATEGTPYLRIVSGCLAYLWRRNFYMAKDQTQIVNVAKQGMLDPYVHVRRIMQDVHAGMAQIHETLEQMLTEMPHLWNDDPSIIDLFGAVEPAQVEMAAEWFELWAGARQ